MFKLFPAGLALALAAPLGAQADTATDINVLRREIETIRADYEARLKALEQRLQAAESANGAGSPASPVATAAVAGNTAAAANATAGGANAFNPAISLILSGSYTHTSQDPARYAITGFQLPPRCRDRPRHARLQPRRNRSSALPPASTPGCAALPTSRCTATTRSRSRRPSCRPRRWATACR